MYLYYYNKPSYKSQTRNYKAKLRPRLFLAKFLNLTNQRSDKTFGNISLRIGAAQLVFN